MTQAQRDAEAIIQSLKTEDQLQADKVARIKELQALGLLSAKQAQAAIDALKPAAKDDDTGGTAGEFRSAGAMMAGSAEAFSTIVSAMGRRSEEVAAIEKMQKAIVDQLKKNAPKAQPVELVGDLTA